MDDASAARPVGSRMGAYVWDGRQWVPGVDGAGNTFDGSQWNRPPDPPMPPFPLGSAASPFADPRYAYGLTRQTSDDLQFIARYTKIMIIISLVSLGVFLVFNVIFISSIAALLSAIVQALPR